MEEYIIEEQRNTPVCGEYDVFVLGGGVAGISAALAAARQNKKVLLVEKSFILGGLATSGLVTIYLPLCDGYGHQVSFGIAEELLKLSIKDWHNEKRGYPVWLGPDKKSEITETDQRYAVDFNPSLFALAAEELLLKEGVQLLYGTQAVASQRQGKRILAVIVENKSGRTAYKADTFVDASGDCDIAYQSGTATVNFSQGNVLAAWYYFLDNGENKLKQLGASDIPEEEKKLGKTAKEPLVNRRFTGLDGTELSEITILSHNSMYRNMKEKMAADAQAIPLSVPTIPQVRMSRRIDGADTLTIDNAVKYKENSIGLVSNWKKRGPVYEIPFGILYNPETVNLICAGRCVSNDDYMWDVLRVIPCCAVTGEAAGTAAALTDDFTRIDIQKLQGILSSNGVKLHKDSY